MKIGGLTIESIESQLFAENAYIVSKEGKTDCLVIDPGFQHAEIIDFVNQNNLAPLAILNTHGHSDHIAGNEALKQTWPDCPIIIGKQDAYKLTDPDANLSGPFGMPLLSPPADRQLVEGEEFDIAGIPLQVLETPGHSKGHIVFAHRSSPNLIFGGDVLFRFGVGRTDFFDGDFDELRDSIQLKLFRFPDETIVFPGHGPHTTIGAEIDHNPYVGIPAGFKR